MVDVEMAQSKLEIAFSRGDPTYPKEIRFEVLALFKKHVLLQCIFQNRKKSYVIRAPKWFEVNGK